MEKFTQEELIQVTSAYRRYKTNPKVFTLTEEERLIGLRKIDKELIEIYDGRTPQVMYDRYCTTIFLSKKTAPADGLNGEDYRTINECVATVIEDQIVDILLELRSGNIPDNTLVEIMYIHLGLAHGVLKRYSELDPDAPGNIYSMLAKEKRKKDGKANN